MSKVADNSVSFGVGLLFGVIAGVVAGVLAAPKSGEEMRQELKETVSNLSQENKELTSCTSISVDLINKMKYTIEKQISKINDAVKAGKMAAAKRKEELESGCNY
ncbi:MAG: hypothetical protein A2287_08340 [Candidatus Melainabacteria bacterium RIFOXYA12_FULL_32_12]|nr:MAG: hypothetical protein A2255_06625 [Candidatus Melainabacteria bacterium RIFOXYA2_FULL_32_9]OGI26317.1 MAG: hypothetical protein A2287_08340 [Candidatus Melainabacteria bacterium RIFOXYA12_FULL_32_12]